MGSTLRQARHVRGLRLRWLAAALLLAPVTRAQAPAAARLEVGWIARDPALSPPASIKAPIDEGWPDAGARVHWVAHVLNRGAQTAKAIPYAWRVDDGTLVNGKVDLPPGDTSVWLTWTWTFARHRVSFEISPPPQLGDATRDDDLLAIDSNALSLGFWIERGVYDWMLQEGRPGFERWAQRELERWNQILARGVYPSTPQGALDRIRIEKVVVLPDGARPANSELDTDFTWTVFNHAYDGSRFLELGSPPGVVADQTIMLHELLHERGLIDLYAYTVTHGGPTSTPSRVDIVDNGRPVPGTPLMPYVSGFGNIVYVTPFDGLMGTQYSAEANLTEHCANGLNLWAGRRTPRWLDQWGNAIDGLSNAALAESYVNRLPRRTDVLLLDEAGVPLSGATVDVYMDHDDDTYRKTYLPSPDRSLAADARGVVTLPGDLLDGLPPMAAPPKSQVIILGVKTSRGRAYVFVPVLTLNLAYFQQGAEHAELTLPIKLQPW